MLSNDIRPPNSGHFPVVRVADHWIARVTYEERELAKTCGFRWDPGKKVWWTPHEAVALRAADVPAMATSRQRKNPCISASRAHDADINIPAPPGLSYLPYQRAGIAYALSHPSILLADEMGLGKTIQAIGVINADPSLKRILIICPASLRLNWARELRSWLVRPLRIEIATPTFFPDSDQAEICVINYDILGRHLGAVHGEEWDLLVADEAHYLKNPKSQRTIAVFGKRSRIQGEASPPISARRRILLTGTPIVNRPVEAWPLLNFLAPREFANFFAFAREYCAAKETRFGWDYSGASNLAKLNEKLRSTCMIRRRKADVLTELPPKRRQIVVLPINGAAAAIAAEKKASAPFSADIDALQARADAAKTAGSSDEYAAAVLALHDRMKVAFDQMATLRYQTAMAKLEMVNQHILDALDGGDEKLVIFGWHKDVISGIMTALRKAGSEAVSITGDTPMPERQANVDRFQTKPECRAFVGNIQAAGTGLTLTAASHVVFAELSFVPGEMSQCEDRCHRIGQRGNVLVQHLVVDDSLDAKMSRALIEKQEIIERALDRAVAQ